MNGPGRSILVVMLAAVLVGLSGTHAQNTNRMDGRLAQRVRAQPNALFDVVIRFDRVAPPIGTPRAEVLRYLRGDLGRQLTVVNAILASYGIKLSPDPNESLWLDSSVAVRLPGRAIEVIAAVANGVDVVFENFRVQLPKVMAQSTASAPAGTPWHLERIGAPGANAAGLRGSGMRVGHLDTGIDTSHPELSGKVVGFAEFNAQGDRVPNAPSRDTTGHGTHTAGLIVGNRVGVAPDARLLSALVLPGGEGTFAQVIAGMQWVLDPDSNPSTDDGARVVSMSLGLPGQFPEFIQAVQNMVRAGALPVFAAGNSGPNAGTVNSPGNLPEPLTVGALDQNGAVAGFSSRGPVTWGAPINQSFGKPDLIAPGVGITSSVPGGGYAALSGTSQAAPIVAGAAAVLRAARPGSSWDAIKNALRDGARSVGSDANAAGRGAVSLTGALEKLGVTIEARPNPQPAPPPASPSPPPAPPASPPPASPPVPPSSPSPSSPVIREITGVPADGVLRGVLQPGPRVMVSGAVQSVEIRLIDSKGQVAYTQTERADPYCFAGDENSVCNAFDTRKISDGRYVVSLILTAQDGKKQEFRGSIQIANGSSPSQTPGIPRSALPEGLLFKPGGLEQASNLPDTGAAEREATWLNSNGSTARFRLPGTVRKGKYAVAVRARGQNHKGWPELELRIDAKRVGRVTVDNASFTVKTFGTYNLKPGMLLEVVFVNDAYDGSPETDRNAILDLLVLRPKKD